MFELFMAGKTLKKWQILVTRTKAETYPEIIMLQKKMPFSSEIRLDITNFLMASQKYSHFCYGISTLSGLKLVRFLTHNKHTQRFFFQ